MKREERRRDMEKKRMDRMDPFSNVEEDANVDPLTRIINHMNRHLASLTLDYNAMLEDLNDPDISVEQKATITSRIDAIKKQMTVVQAQIDRHTQVRNFS